jgi:hypothetical protein
MQDVEPERSSGKFSTYCVEPEIAEPTRIQLSCRPLYGERETIEMDYYQFKTMVQSRALIEEIHRKYSR